MAGVAGRAWLGTAAAQGRVTGFLRATRPLCEWLDARVGDSEMAR